MNASEQRMKFVEFWAKYVRTHKDRDWSRQQNTLIDSCLRSASMTKEQFLQMKRKNNSGLTTIRHV